MLLHSTITFFDQFWHPQLGVWGHFVPQRNTPKTRNFLSWKISFHCELLPPLISLCNKMHLFCTYDTFHQVLVYSVCRSNVLLPFHVIVALAAKGLKSHALVPFPPNYCWHFSGSYTFLQYFIVFTKTGKKKNTCRWRHPPLSIHDRCCQQLLSAAHGEKGCNNCTRTLGGSYRSTFLNNVGRSSTPESKMAYPSRITGKVLREHQPQKCPKARDVLLVICRWSLKLDSSTIRAGPWCHSEARGSGAELKSHQTPHPPDNLRTQSRKERVSSRPLCWNGKETEFWWSSLFKQGFPGLEQNVSLWWICMTLAFCPSSESFVWKCLPPEELCCLTLFSGQKFALVVLQSSQNWSGNTNIEVNLWFHTVHCWHCFDLNHFTKERTTYSHEHRTWRKDPCRLLIVTVGVVPLFTVTDLHSYTKPSRPPPRSDPSQCPVCAVTALWTLSFSHLSYPAPLRER